MSQNLIDNVPVAEAGKCENATMGGKCKAVISKTTVEDFLSGSYEFRHNVLSSKYEYRQLNHDAEGNVVGHTAWAVLSKEALNGMALAMRREVDEEKSWKSVIEEAVYSTQTPDYDPIADYLHSLPAWDGVDRVRPLFRRLPGVNERQLEWLASWIRSAVAHWLQLDALHGNEQVLMLIGDQGAEKSTFLARLLPPHLMGYFLDHVNLSNKFDKEMALTNNLLANIDEFDQIKPSQQAELKQMITKFKVNGRQIYGRTQTDRKRYVSFTATTNDPRPLKDPTGSRRYLCVKLPKGCLIDNRTPIDYSQLYAQVKYEVCNQGQRYWFNQEEVHEIEQHNLQFQHVDDLETMVTTCFRRPEEGEVVKPMLTREVVSMMAKQYPELRTSHSTAIKVGRVLKMLNFEQKNLKQGSCYYVVPMVEAA